MVLVPGAAFSMGSDRGMSNETPVHEALVPGFQLGRTEVTNAQYAKFLAALKTDKNGDSAWRHPDQVAGKDHSPAYWSDKTLNDPASPVVGVDWFDAFAYARWSGSRLPTEAEWELAASAGENRLYPWGNGRPLDGKESRANYDPGPPEGDGFPVLAPAGSYPGGAAVYGALNMAGNVWEWTSDIYEEKYYSISPRQSPTGPNSGSERVVRGGSWNSPAGNLRTTARSAYSPQTRSRTIGIRCAADLTR
jgi:formylglycine-generating enzyme required for sulfatase activity